MTKEVMIQLVSHLVFVLVANFLFSQTVSAPPASTAATGPASQRSDLLSLGRKGLIFTTANKDYQLRIHGYVEMDNRLLLTDPKGNNFDKFLFRRIRPLVEGTLFKIMDFHLVTDLGQNNPQVQDAYVEFKSLPWAKLRAGKFKPPLALETLKPELNYLFTERSMVSNLTPTRELGVQVGATVLQGSVTYAIGYFNAAGDGSNGPFTEWRNNKEGIIRTFWQPFRAQTSNLLRQLGLGLAGSVGDEHDALPSFKTVGQNTFFQYSKLAFAGGQHRRLIPQGYYYYGPLGILTDYIISSQRVENAIASQILTHHGWQATASMMLTGEANNYGAIEPLHAFATNKGLHSLGAFEVDFRYSHLGVDPNAFPSFADRRTSAQRATEWGVGLNWYWNRYARLTTDFEHTGFKMASPILQPLHTENAVSSRLQLQF